MLEKRKEHVKVCPEYKLQIKKTKTDTEDIESLLKNAALTS